MSFVCQALRRMPMMVYELTSTTNENAQRVEGSGEYVMPVIVGSMPKYRNMTKRPY